MTNVNQVNNAGIIVAKETTEFTAEDFSSIMSTNFEASYHLCQLAHPLLKASATANIVFISSVAGVVAFPTISIYASSKGIYTYFISSVISINLGNSLV